MEQKKAHRDDAVTEQAVELSGEVPASTSKINLEDEDATVENFRLDSVMKRAVSKMD